ncbi:MAG: integrase arm-type DNA-binding domain-containing protein, partial [Candidatus Riflebacteria bacterium]|nr:integrase arm-type DNA-binding domain-containing protein [Candidatus Riflebacteria bacterium]
MSLSDTAIRLVKPKEKTFKLSDSGGLYLEVAPSGGKWWRLKYRMAGKEKRISLGVYPEVSLKEARERREDARRLLASGVDPSVNRKATKMATANSTTNSFEVVAREYLDRAAATLVPEYVTAIRQRLEANIFPWLGGRPIADITPPQLLEAIRRLEERAAYSAHRLLGDCGRVFRYAISTGRVTSDPSRDLRGALTPVKEGHLAAIVEPTRVSHLLRALYCYTGSFVVICALKLAPLLVVRPGELRTARWADIDLDAGEWRFLITKTQTTHIVPLTRQSVAILRELYPLTGTGEYVFPGGRTPRRPMSENAVLYALRSLGFAKNEMTCHGWRAV